MEKRLPAQARSLIAPARAAYNTTPTTRSPPQLAIAVASCNRLTSRYSRALLSMQPARKATNTAAALPAGLSQSRLRPCHFSHSYRDELKQILRSPAGKSRMMT